MERVWPKSGRAQGREGCRRERFREGDYWECRAPDVEVIVRAKVLNVHNIQHYVVCYPQETVLKI